MPGVWRSGLHSGTMGNMMRSAPPNPIDFRVPVAYLDNAGADAVEIYSVSAVDVLAAKVAAEALHAAKYGVPAVRVGDPVRDHFAAHAPAAAATALEALLASGDVPDAVASIAAAEATRDRDGRPITNAALARRLRDVARGFSAAADRIEDASVDRG